MVLVDVMIKSATAQSSLVLLQSCCEVSGGRGGVSIWVEGGVSILQQSSRTICGVAVSDVITPGTTTSARGLPPVLMVDTGMESLSCNENTHMHTLSRSAFLTVIHIQNQILRGHVSKKEIRLKGFKTRNVCRKNSENMLCRRQMSLY